ncbi:MAG: cyclic nucleotide-binding domain-containing protein [Deltaproteobacteria bacterium]|nr:cyclic nucleotide-binding domain-containing protein [Deltaproteobacteria bacterium]
MEAPWRLVPAVRRAERERFAWFAAFGGLLTLAQTMGLAGAEALFLARLGAARLPATFVLASAVTVGASLLYALRVGRARNDRVLAELAFAAALGVGGAAAALWLGQEAALPALLCVYFAAQAVLTSHYWTFAGDCFDTLAAKRLVPLLTVGMSVGGALGGAAAIGVLARLDPTALLWGWAGALAGLGALALAGRRRLAAWRPLAAAEEDETSVAGMRAAARYLRRSPLGRWLTVSALAMVLALFAMQYLYSAVLADAFPDERALARFLALYLAASNGVEIAVELLAPWGIRRLGVPSANLLHPVLTLGAFLGLLVDPRLPAAVAARANRELLENALAGPIRNLSYNALPGRFRARVRAFLEGIVIYSGMSLAGVVLLAVGHVELPVLAATGLALAALYLLANLRVRREYLRALAAELRAGRLDLRELRGELGPRELAELATLWEPLLHEPGERAGQALLELAAPLAAQGFAGVVRTGLAHPSARVRAGCLAALAVAGDDGNRAPWLDGLADPEPEVRRAAVVALPEPLRTDAALEALLRARLTDPAARVRAAAAARLGADGAGVLGAMLADPASALAALEVLPPALAAQAAGRLADPEPRLRAAALAALARAADPGALPPIAALLAAAADPDASVRRAALPLLGSQPGDEAMASLARGLRDPVREVRTAAVRALERGGAAGARAARAALDAPEEHAVAAGLRALAGSGAAEARGWLRAAYAAHVREAWESLLLARAGFEPAGASAGAAVAARFLPAACADAFARALRLALQALARLEDGPVVRSVERALRHAPGRARADALEVLTHLGDREASQALAVLLELAPVEEKLGPLRRLGAPPRTAAEALARAAAHPAPWVRRAAHAAADSGADPEEIVTMKHLLALRQVSLLSALSLERLQAVERIAREVEYLKGEVIVREGEPGDELYLLVEGAVDVVKQAGTAREERVNALGAGSYFGEMAVFDGAPRSATVVAASDARVLVLAGARLRELVHEMPELAFDLLRVLAERLRRVEERAAGGA